MNGSRSGGGAPGTSDEEDPESYRDVKEIERVADALESVDERLRVQNAALVELVRTFDWAAKEQGDLHRSSRDVASAVEDAALDLSEMVDLDAVDRVTDQDARTDGGVLGYNCPKCGDVSRCDVDDNGQRRCPDCGRVVSTVATDGGTREIPDLPDRPVRDDERLRRARSSAAALVEWSARVGVNPVTLLREELEERDDVELVDEDDDPELVTDGGTRAPREQTSIDEHVRSADTLAGVGDQDTECRNGEEGCPGPNAGELPCFDCWMEGA